MRCIWNHLVLVACLLVAGASSLAADRAARSRAPSHAVAGLDVAEGLEATLFAAEPQVLSLTNLDIDHRGRVWVCEVVNYRRNKGKRPEGDRILILEDTDHDGIADTTKVFYQGNDIDAAIGICVLGNQVIVSCSPQILVLTDEDGDDKPDRKDVLFSGVGQPQHDHSAHSFCFGPDGKYYWNFGNTGQKVLDKEGNQVIDKDGHPVIDSGKPYLGGMAFRCNADGSDFEVLAHNFRNPYEVAVDSFGTLWQSDNDDDGNRSVRINYLMEFGNYGFREELTGAGWQSPRTNREAEIPLRHWHLNDPGVVPNLLQTGAGSPTGITVYEGRLLPKHFQDELIHCDAGPSVVRAYPTTPEGAGYKAKIVNILHGKRDNWFRPVDVCVAPDGSLFITDWYDPGVGGHAQGDTERGRVFRVAPLGATYDVPTFDVSTPGGAVAALLNPNASARYMGWEALQGMGAKAVPALENVFKGSDNPRYRARALWALGKLPGVDASRTVEAAITDANPDIRIVGVRLARQIGVELHSVVGKLVADPSPAVRRECAIALRHSNLRDAATLWAALAAAHDGHDRWYLEALGIGADGHWDACLEAWLAKVHGDWSSAAGHDIIWRSRAAKTPALLAKVVLDAATAEADLPRYFRAFDFQSGPIKESALIELAFGSSIQDPGKARLVSTEALKRLTATDIGKHPHQAAALEALLGQVRGTSQFVELVGKFNVATAYGDLLVLAQAHPDDQAGVDATMMLLQKRQFSRLQAALEGDDLSKALATAQALANAADGRSEKLLMPLVTSEARDLELRRQAARALATTRNGALGLVDLAKNGRLDPALVPVAAFCLHAAPWSDVKEQAMRLFPVAAAKDSELPPISKLVTMTGVASRGQRVFAEVGECAKCHQVNGQGKEVGPNLSEIGDKLSRQAVIEAILYPSAGISHGYETYVAVLESGNVVTGIKVSETNDSVTLKTGDAIIRTFAKDEIEEFVKQPISIMPADLQRVMTTKELVDVVEYLTTLRKKEG